ncbi:hypothetical protein SAMN04515647_3637 [Cohaesibacter sp. ES.047]|nr:hypothetical protein SAMN04515647_3637 [Cohaesibacter sp. ES.047]
MHISGGFFVATSTPAKAIRYQCFRKLRYHTCYLMLTTLPPDCAQ